LLASRRSLPSILRFVLIVGGVILAAFYYFVETKPPWVHAWAVAAVTATLVLVLATVFAMEHPFSGPARIEPNAPEFQLDEMKGE
jgi:peptidoglycan/LPS O-acetylase OafA/YrhL